MSEKRSLLKNIKYKKKRGYTNIPSLLILFEKCYKEIAETTYLRQKTVHDYLKRFYTYIQCRDFRCWIIDKFVADETIKFYRRDKKGVKRYKVLKPFEESRVFKHATVNQKAARRDIKIFLKIKEYTQENKKWFYTTLKRSLNFSQYEIHNSIQRLLRKQLLIPDYTRPRKVMKDGKLHKTIPYTLVTNDYQPLLYKWYA